MSSSDSETVLSRPVADKGNAAAEQTSSPQTEQDHRAAFLSTFTPEEEKNIMRKIDRRLLILAGIIYMVKQVRKEPRFQPPSS